jgi:DNA mismatch endonuclease (patch repair protein)
MTDIFDRQKRSLVMSRIRGSNNKSTELKLISVFAELGIKGWRRGSKMFGKPDFIFPKLKIAVFADGCFWHGHDCRNHSPKTHKKYWTPKIARNKQRDIEVSENLQSKGWRVIRIWECELRKKNRDLLLAKLRPLSIKRSNWMKRIHQFLVKIFSH